MGRGFLKRLAAGSMAALMSAGLAAPVGAVGSIKHNRYFR